MGSKENQFRSFKEFWPFYLTQHQDPKCQALHFIGTFLGLVIFFGSFLATFKLGYLIALVVGYSFAWLGHFLFEKNKPATFRYPFYSLLADFRMLWLKCQMILKKILKKKGD